MTATVTRLRTDKPSPRKPKTVAPSRVTKAKPQGIPLKQRLAGYGFGALSLTMAGLSISHLASGFAAATHRPLVEGWIMAGSTDLGFVAAETLPFLATAAAASDLRHARLGLTVAVVAASAYFNFLSMGPWGLAVPAMLAAFLHFASRLLIGRAR